MGAKAMRRFGSNRNPNLSADVLFLESRPNSHNLASSLGIISILDSELSNSGVPDHARAISSIRHRFKLSPRSAR